MALQGEGEAQQITEQRPRFHLRRDIELHPEPHLDVPKRERRCRYRIRKVYACISYRIGNQLVNALYPHRQAEMEFLSQQDFRHRNGDAMELFRQRAVYVQIINLNALPSQDGLRYE